VPPASTVKVTVPEGTVTSGVSLRPSEFTRKRSLLIFQLPARV